MKLESHATPIEGTPQQRYATLHRALEQGLDSDDLWGELASVSATLGHTKEAKRCARRIQDAARRNKYERTLALGDKTDRDGTRDPAAAPAASNAGRNQRKKDSGEDKSDPGVIDHLLDAGQYMLHQHMPWLVLSTMLAFPLIVGLGGLLTAGGSPVLLAAIAAVPGLCVLVVVAAMAHETLRNSITGEGDVPEFPEFAQLLHGARTFLWDAVLVFALFFGVPVAMAIGGVPLTGALPSIAISIYFAPLAFAIRHVRRDMRSFAPVFLWRAARRCGRGYGLVAIAIALAFAPAAIVAWAIVGYAAWVQIAIVGPLCVLPTLASSRLLGTWLDSHRSSLGYLLTTDARAPASMQAVSTRPVTKPTQPRNLRRPAALESFRAPARNASTTKKASSAARPVRSASAFAPKKASRPTPRAIEGRRPTASNPTVQSNPLIEEKPQVTYLNDLPDIEGFADAYVVQGEERLLKGAASRPR